jgi:hypothetical protein
MCEVIDLGQTQNSVEYRISQCVPWRRKLDYAKKKEITVDYSHPRRPTTGLATLRLKARIKTSTAQAREKI